MRLDSHEKQPVLKQKGENEGENVHERGRANSGK